METHSIHDFSFIWYLHKFKPDYNEAEAVRNMNSTF